MTDEQKLESGQSPDRASDAVALTQGQKARQRRMSILAHAKPQDLYECWQSLALDPRCEMLRGPETGLLALRGRIGGGGAPFNFGEATVTRATVRLENGAIGHAVALGRNQAKAKLAAIIDALCEDDTQAITIEEKVLTPLSAIADDADQQQFKEAMATKVNFFTMVRGED